MTLSPPDDETWLSRRLLRTIELPTARPLPDAKHAEDSNEATSSVANRFAFGMVFVYLAAVLSSYSGFQALQGQTVRRPSVGKPSKLWDAGVWRWSCCLASGVRLQHAAVLLHQALGCISRSPCLFLEADFGKGNSSRRLDLCLARYSFVR
ncbi:hypothetical protein BKA70DRAFT_1555198 [Coprinopsis sp. MPI-PUGE-AT-0042]|nr:hypothetical protein BKA70DRAFT_1555198 [Coprinopsis sp. MPI-PUGE-AT-0042]